MKIKNNLLNKKADMGMSVSLVIILIIAIITLVVYLGGSTSFFKDSFDFFNKKLPGALEEIDCDNDGLLGEWEDHCPCIFAERGNQQEGLAGCPKGTSESEARGDANKCRQYVTGTENNYAFYEKGACPKDETCERYCDIVKKKTMGLITGTATKGIEGDRDLIISSLSLAYGDKESSKTSSDPNAKISQFVIDFNGEPDMTIAPKFEIKKTGRDPIIRTYSLGFATCNENKHNCEDISPPLAFDNKLDEPYKSKGSERIKIGASGGACDGREEETCYLRVTIDNDEKYDEGYEGEKNNVAWILIVAKRQRDGDVKWNRLQIMISDRLEKNTIADEWPAGDNTDLRYVKKELTDEGFDNAGNIPQQLHRAGYCWVISEYDAYFSTNSGNYFGAVAVEENTVIHATNSSPLAYIKEESGQPEAYNAAKEHTLLTARKSDGTMRSLICKGAWWYECDSSKEGKSLQIKGQKYTCKNSVWMS